MHALVGGGQKQHIAHINIFKNALFTRDEATRVTAISLQNWYVQHLQGTSRPWGRPQCKRGRQESTHLNPVFKLRMKNFFPDYTFSGFTQKPYVTPGMFKVPRGNILAWHFMLFIWLPQVKPYAHSKPLAGSRNSGSSPRPVHKATTLHPFPVTPALILIFHHVQWCGSFIPNGGYEISSWTLLQQMPGGTLLSF